MKRVAVAVLFVLIAAVLIVWLGPRSVRSRQLSDAKDKWAASSIDKYRWTIDTGCFGLCTNGNALTITVQSGRPDHVSPPNSPRWAIKAAPMTVEDLFASIERKTHADGFAVTYDETYGFPVQGSFDPSRNSIDDESGFTVTNFKILA